MKNTYLFFLVANLVLFTSHSTNATKPKPGLWKAELELNATTKLPFMVELIKVGAAYHFIIQNGQEKIFLNQVTTSADSIYISFSTFDAVLKLKVLSKNTIRGAWYNKAKSDNYCVPLKASRNSYSRYPALTNQNIDIDEKWEVTFSYNDDPEKAVGLFRYSSSPSNILEGTFLTETGDYRFLEGATIGDSLYLSTFDGSHAFLFNACLKGDTLWGEFFSGKHYKTNWYAVKNKDFELTHPDSLTRIVDQAPLKFSLKDLNGKTYNYPNALTKNKVVLLQIMGTWCPNCLDESNYLRGVYEKYQSQLEIIAITFETQKTLIDKQVKVEAYKNALNLDYTFLIGGDACKPCATNLFPQLSEIISFPTLIFIDKVGEIRKIHTGFSGPGTGVYYDRFVTETNQFIEMLVNE